jgi:hypothetical protein
MNNSPRHNVGSVADPHWVVDEEHYLKAVADSDHFFACWQDTLEQRDKALVFLQSYRHFEPMGNQPHGLPHDVDLLLKECGK